MQDQSRFDPFRSHKFPAVDQAVQIQGGMVTSPHYLASQAGRDILAAGGTAVEAIVATAATLAAVYPHMTGIGGDAFWLIAFPDGRTVAIDGCGRLAQHATHEFYEKAGHTAIPWRGGAAANTPAGAVSSWETALRESTRYGKPLPLVQLLERAIHYSENGHIISSGEAALLQEKRQELSHNAAFSRAFRPALKGELRRNPALANTLRHLVQHGLRSFYEGSLARSIAGELEAAKSPIRLDDLVQHQATVGRPLELETSWGRLYNTAPPTQGVASLLILALFDRLGIDRNTPDSFDHVHGLVEATKRAFQFRNRTVDGSASAEARAHTLLGQPQALAELASRISATRALPWTEQTQWGDTTWMGATDRSGITVSMIQSLYFEFGSGVLLPETGILWQNRGSSFRLTRSGWNHLLPGAKPFHTLNPAAARLHDGRIMVYGTMGGEGQPQTQATIFSRHVHYGIPLQEAVSKPRWLLGRTWGDESTSLKIEPGFDPTVISALKTAGHVVEELPAMTSLMGHAGAIIRHTDGRLEGATDPRSDGAVATCTI